MAQSTFVRSFALCLLFASASTSAKTLFASTKESSSHGSASSTRKQTSHLRASRKERELMSSVHPRAFSPPDSTTTTTNPAAPSTGKPTTNPTATPTPAPTKTPTSLRPTTARPTQSKPIPAWNTCAVRAKLFDDPHKTRCTFSEECATVPNGCCLADSCLCGVFSSKAQDCIPAIDVAFNRAMDRSESDGGPPLPVDSGPGPASSNSNDACSVPENNVFWDVEKYPEYADNTRCTNSHNCPYPNECCLAYACICGHYGTGGNRAHDCVGP